MIRIEKACGNDKDLFYEIESLLMENNMLICNLTNGLEDSLEDIDQREGLKRSVYEYYEEDFSLMGRMCKDLESARELLEQVKFDNKILTSLWEYYIKFC